MIAALPRGANSFAVDLHVPDRTFAFLDIDLPVIERSTFLDNRIDAPLADARPVAMAELPPIEPPARLGWLLHTSFCCSTLLARALHLGAEQVSLREPLVLRRLADARHAGWNIDDFVAPSVGLLGRPWAAGGMVVIKPTHVALNVAADLVAATDARAVLLTSTLDDFLVSNIKKTPETLARIPVLAERALGATSFARALPASALAPPSLLAAAALQWAAQRMLAFEVSQRLGRGRVRWLDAHDLTASPEAVLLSVARWLGSTAPDADLRARALMEFGRHAKATSRPYGPGQREAEAAAIRASYDGDLGTAKAWFDRHVAPSIPATAGDMPRTWALDPVPSPET